MNEEMMTMVEEIENNEAAELEVYEEPVKTGNGIAGKLAVGIGIAVAGATAFVWHKTKAKREQRAIRKLEKKGYVIYKDEPTEVVEVEAEVVSEQNEDVQEDK